MLTHLAPTTKRINRIRVPVNPNPEAVCFNRPVLRPANFGLYHRPPTSSTPSPSGSSISAFGSHSPAFRTLGSFKSFLAQPNTSQSRQSFKPLYSRLGGGGRSDRPGSTANLGFRKPSSPSLWYYSSPKNAANPPRNAEHSSPDTGAGRRPSHNSQSQSHSHSQSESSHGAGARPQFGSEAHNQRNRWSSRDNTSRARLDSKAPISHTLANMCIWDVHCQVFSGSMVMINQYRFSHETWRSNEAVLWSRKQAKKLGVGGNAVQKREFHSSERRQGWPLLWQAMVILKSSSALSVVQTVGRVALTLLPMAVLKRSIFQKLMKHLPLSEHPTLATMHRHMAASIKTINIAVWALLIIPGSLFAATILASMERTPVTGRWRLILLSPEEERSVAADLAGEGWRNEVANILTEGDTEPLPQVIPLSDWRTQWVLETWRHLESVVPLLQADDEEVQQVFDRLARAKSNGEDGSIPYPPPSHYPLMPRPRATTILHAVAPCISEAMEQEAVKNLSEPQRNSTSASGSQAHNEPLTARDPPAHTLLGPPYSVLLVEKPEAANAFAYGFGPSGGGGVVVYSGFIDDILQKTLGSGSGSASASSNQPHQLSTTSTNTSSNDASKGLLSYFTGSGTQTNNNINNTNTTSSLDSTQQQSNQQEQPYVTPTHYVPTPEQTTHLAILLAHELSHLLLSHHLETLSSNSILIPSVVGMFADLARTLAFPATMVFGPFVNDALWEVSKMGTGEVMRNSQACTVKHLEVEADVVGARLLAYAGFDAGTAIQFWEDREALETCAETQRKPKPNPIAFDEQGHPLALDPNQQPSLWTQIDNWIPITTISSSVGSIQWPNWLKFGSSQTSEGAGTWFTRTGVSHDQGSHPISAERVKRLKAELERWEKERVKHVQHVQRLEHAQRLENSASASKA